MVPPGKPLIAEPKPAGAPTSMSQDKANGNGAAAAAGAGAGALAAYAGRKGSGNGERSIPGEGGGADGGAAAARGQAEESNGNNSAAGANGDGSAGAVAAAVAGGEELDGGNTAGLSQVLFTFPLVPDVELLVMQEDVDFVQRIVVVSWRIGEARGGGRRVCALFVRMHNCVDEYRPCAGFEMMCPAWDYSLPCCFGQVAVPFSRPPGLPPDTSIKFRYCAVAVL